jgi:23S rRNA (uridine2552-2'-O)-methyltransferase
MSDIAPNMLGIGDVDHDRSKVFQGRGFQPLPAELRRQFESVKLRKPKASRSRSAEVHVLARGYRMV